ncbi:SAVED domain-containing protein [Massilia oculi]|uniref:SAVED domain-containing protein n=1 Tax=Massilia oculi TaxID=945844 RepID=UPI0028AD9713|nr:SAVED domain-containing protein [Massilia oculi]
MIQLFYKFVDRGIDWVFRPRSLGVQLLKYGAAIFVMTLGADIAFGAEYKSESSSFNFHLTTSGGLPALAINGAYLLGAGLIFLGVGLLVRQVAQDIKKERRQLLIVVELRGLHGAPDTPAKDVIMRDFLGQRQRIILDFRPKRSGDLVDKHLVLEKLATLVPMVEALSAGRDSSDVFVAIGGLAAVPALFLAGVLLDDESNVTIFDWHRDLKAWQVPRGFDDGKRLHPMVALDVNTPCSDVVLVVSCSYHVDAQDVAEAFPRYPVVRLDAEEKLANRFWSEEKQAAFVTEFRDAVQRLLNMGVKRIHLILAAPSSLAIRMGMSYDRRLHPDLVVYQYERSLRPAYPWGLHVPSHGRPQAAIVEAP